MIIIYAMDFFEVFCYNEEKRKKGLSVMENMIKELDGIKALNSIDALLKFEGVLEEAAQFTVRNQTLDTGLWKKFVEVFRMHGDGIGDTWVSWRSEYWGKMMRGACMVLKYTHDEGVYRILEASVRDLLSAADELGRISGYSVKDEFIRWDIWGRKYVMLGMMYFMEVSDNEELKAEIVSALTRHADYIIERIGEGKLDIRKCSKNWEGLNSCSILEPMVKLYKLTGYKRYLDFAEYIISTGFIESENIIEAAYENKRAPHEYAVTKAYEMMSCFEGLLEYYSITGNEKHKAAALNLGYRIIEDELSIIGCAGVENEVFDNAKIKQTKTDCKEVGQETCVTVTYMKFASKLLSLSGDPTFADSIERAFYNAYLGSLNSERIPFKGLDEKNLPGVLPFDSYSPLISGIRGGGLGGYNYFPDNTFYGCCAAIGAAGAGVIPEFAVMKCDTGIVINYYERGKILTKTPSGKELEITVDTDYPYAERIEFTLKTADTESFDIILRVPAWCKNATLSTEGSKEGLSVGYNKFSYNKSLGEKIVLTLPMEIRKTLPAAKSPEADLFIAYEYGPIVLAADKRILDPDAPLNLLTDKDGRISASKVFCPEIKEAHICLEAKTEDGGTARLIDYASAGKTWSEKSRTAAWIRRK